MAINIIHLIFLFQEMEIIVQIMKYVLKVDGNGNGVENSDYIFE